MRTKNKQKGPEARALAGKPWVARLAQVLGSFLVMVLCASSLPSWAMDTNRLVFVRADNIWVANSDGTGELPILKLPKEQGQELSITK